MNNTRWSLVIPTDTDRALRAFLAQRGAKKGDLSRFVDEAVLARLFELTVEQVKERNRTYAQQEILDVIEDMLANE